MSDYQCEKNNDLASILFKKICDACFVTTTATSVSQYYDTTGVLNSTESVALSIINFSDKTANMLLTDLDNTMDYSTVVTYRDYNKYTMEYSTVTQDTAQQSSNVVNYSKCSYDKMFEPCGALFPVNFEGIKPINDPNNNSKFQAYTFTKQRACTIQGYVNSLITVAWKCENMFEVSVTMNLKDSQNRIVKNEAVSVIEIGTCKEKSVNDCKC